MLKEDVFELRFQMKLAYIWTKGLISDPVLK